MPKNSCPMCSGLKDKRASMCQDCRMVHNHPRQGTGKGWAIHETLGYVMGSFGGATLYQHREIMSFHKGRPLECWEHVHHKDHDKTNNDISNLEIVGGFTHGKIHLTSERAKEMSKLGHAARWGYSNLPL